MPEPLAQGLLLPALQWLPLPPVVPDFAPELEADADTDTEAEAEVEGVAGWVEEAEGLAEGDEEGDVASLR